MTVTVLDQIPVSQNQDIKVELIGKSAPTRKDLDDKRGVWPGTSSSSPTRSSRSSSAIA